MKFLTDSEILKWNDRLKNKNIRVSPVNNYASDPYISFGEDKTRRNVPSYNLIHDPELLFNFTFSVSDNRKDDFFEIFKKISSVKIGTMTVKPDYHDKLSSIDKYSSIDIDNLSKKVNTAQHKIKDKLYTRYSYQFNGLLSHIMLYVSFIEDTIHFFQKKWEYNEDGSENLLLKYPIGSIVSKKNDQSKDYLVMDYKYNKQNDDYHILFSIIEMKYISNIIEYGESLVENEENLVYSRNNRIDDILQN